MYNPNMALAFAETKNTQLFASAFYKQYSGLFKDVDQNGINVLMSKKQSLYGFTFMSEHEGPYLAQNRAYLKYAIRVKLNNEYYITGGFSAGLISLKVAGSATGIDGGAGVGIFSEKMTLLMSMEQITESTYQPYKNDIILRKYLQYYFDKKFDLNDNAQMVLNSRGHLLFNNKSNIWLGAKINYKPFAGFGVGISSRGSALFLVDYELAYKNTYLINFVFAYEIVNAILVKEHSVATYQIGIVLKKQKNIPKNVYKPEGAIVE